MIFRAFFLAAAATPIIYSGRCRPQSKAAGCHTCGWNKEERAASVNDIIITAKWSLTRLHGNAGSTALMAYMTRGAIDFLNSLQE